MFELFTSKIHILSSLLISCLVQTCSFIFSHLLYFSYFIYFSPYLLKLVKFLAPLLIFTCLVLLTCLVNDTLFSNVIAHHDKDILEKTQHAKDDESEEEKEDLEMYKVFFIGSSETKVKERQVEVLERNSMHMHEKRSGNFSKILNQFERMSSVSEENKNIEKVVENHKAERSVRHEWNRTLACKLYEERRNNVGGDEGMDSLWEASYAKNDSPKNEKKKGKRTSIKDEFDEGDDDNEGQLCCLQAFKLSSGRKMMSLGVGIRPNLVKISKAIKGIGWLHRAKRHSKKVHNGD